MKKQNKTVLTTRDLCVWFGCTTATVNNWRKGSKRIAPLAYKEELHGDRNRVLFDPAVVVKWAGKNNLEPLMLLEALLSTRRVK